jgi:hypothetical protein
MLASGLLTAGGLSWLVKIGVIVATDGRVIDTGPAAVLMTAGIVLLLLGAAGTGAWLVGRRHPALHVLAAVGGVATLVAGSVGLGWVGTTLLRGVGPAYFDAEAGLLVVALLWSAVGLAALARARRPATPARVAA